MESPEKWPLAVPVALGTGFRAGGLSRPSTARVWPVPACEGMPELPDRTLRGSFHKTFTQKDRALSFYRKYPAFPRFSERECGVRFLESQFDFFLNHHKHQFLVCSGRTDPRRNKSDNLIVVTVSPKVRDVSVLPNYLPYIEHNFTDCRFL